MSLQVRKIIKIDEDKCNGCGLCIPSCAEGALQIIDGKARLINDAFCDGLGNCLSECPQGAIEIIEREAEPFDEAAVEEHLRKLQSGEIGESCPACAGSMEQNLRENKHAAEQSHPDTAPLEAELSHWPIQWRLVAPESRFLKNPELLVAADCVPFAFADFHRKLLAGKSLLVGCPKLDDASGFQQKLTDIFQRNPIQRVTVGIMEVPCCFALEKLVQSALENAGRRCEINRVVVGVDGSLKD